MSTTITLKGLTKTFPGSAPGAGGVPTTAVDHVDLRIESGELFFLLGPSGCGKTTMLRMVAGFIEPTSGRILFQSAPRALPSGEAPEGSGTVSVTRDVTFLPPNKRNTGMVFQSYALWPHMTVAQNVAFGLNIRKVPAAERDRRVADALKMVRMEQYGARKPNQLSGGQQQRVALARALVIRPDVLLLDEPLSNLDAKLRLELRSEIRRICKEAGGTHGTGTALPQSRQDSGTKDSGTGGITTIYVTHDQKEALSIADRVAIVNQGKIVQMGAPAELYRRPRSKFVAEFLGETNFVPGKIVGEEYGKTVVQTALGKLVSTTVAPGASGDVVCSIRPEALRVNAPDGTNTIHGTVVESVYLGETAQLEVDATRGVRLRVAALNPGTASRSGEGITLGVSAEDVVVVAG